MNNNVLMRLNNPACSPVNKCVFDIETIDWTEPYAIGLYDGLLMNILEGRDCVHNFLNAFLTKRYRQVVAYAHNGGKFDFSFLLEELFKPEFYGKFKIDIMRINSRIVQIKIYTLKENGNVQNTWILRDSMALLKFRLAYLTEHFNVEHKKGEFDHAGITWDNWEEKAPEWKPYLASDCMGLYEVMDKFEKFIISNFGVSLRKNVTLAQLAMNIYRANYMPVEIPNYQSRELEIRGAYFGGRTEIFKMYGEDLNYYDVNSLYPYVMKKYPVPVGVPIKSYDMHPEDFGIMNVTVNVPDKLDIPLLPYRTENGKLIFPGGTFTGMYCSPEIQKAISLGYDVEINYGYKFRDEHIFTDYINELYKIKEKSESGNVDYLVSKLLMNSLYGKFGQRRERKQIVLYPEDTIGLEPLDFFGESPVWFKEVESRSRHILPAIAAFVTSYARLHLYSLLERNDPFYCDTDSLVTKSELDTGTALGQLKLEMKIKEAVFLLPKMYGIKTLSGEQIKCKGFPREFFDYHIFHDAFKSGDYSALKFSKRQLATPFESLRRNKQFVSMIEQTRSVVTRYDKRIILDGINTEPVKIGLNSSLNKVI